MRNSNKDKFFLLGSLFILGILSCVQDGDFKEPSLLGEENNKELAHLLSSTATSISISDLKNQFVYGEATQIISDIFVKGYVTSSDATGNFYKEIFLQDRPVEPTAAIKLVLNQTDTYNQFNIGREVYIKLQGLFLGETRSGDGVITIGGKKNSDGDEVELLTVNQIPEHVFRSEITEVMEPVRLKFSQISRYHIGMFVRAENIQFPISLSGESYVDPQDDFDTIRMLESCEGFGYVNFPMETSAFADFKNVVLPTEAGGAISGVINKTYNGSDFVLVLNGLNDVRLTGSKCAPLNISDFNVIFEEDFNTATDNINLGFAYWTNFAETGSELWTEQVYRANGYAEFSGYSTGDAINIAWLISPGLDMDIQSNEFLNFKTAQHHLDSADNSLEIYVSTNYDGVNVLAAQWESVDANLASISDAWYAFVDSGLIDISTYAGTLYVAFKVQGSGTNSLLDGAYHIDDFKVLVEE